MSKRYRARGRLVALSYGALCWCATLASSSNAAESVHSREDGEPLTLRVAVEEALLAHPELQTVEATRAASDARVDSAGLAPAWAVTSDVENVLGTGAVSGMSAAEITLGVERVFELGSKRAARLSLAEAERDVALRQIEAVRLTVSADVTETFIRALAAEQELRALERSVALAKDVTEAAGRRVRAGRSSEAESSRARVDAAELEIERLTLLNERSALHRELRRLMGSEPSPRHFALAGSLDPLPAAPEVASIVATMESAPAVQRSIWERQLAQARLRVAETQRRPDLTLGVGVRALTEDDDVAFVLSGSMDLGVERRARSDIAEARAEIARADASAQAGRRDLEARARGLSDALALARRELQLLNDVVIPESRKAEELLLRGYQLGRFSYLEVADAQRRSVEGQRRSATLALRYHITILDLGRLLGLPRSTEGLSP